MSLNKENSCLKSDISINENNEKYKDENKEENIQIIKPRNFLITYYKKTYKKGNKIIEELEKNTFDFYFENEEEIKNEKEEEKINEQNEKNKDEKNELKEEKKEEDEIIEWDNEEEDENYYEMEEENSDSENEYKSSINFILSKLKSYKKNIEKQNKLNIKEKYNSTLKNFNSEIKKSCLKNRYENKNDSLDTTENSINSEKKNVNFSKFINVFIFKKDDDNKKENESTFIKTYIKSI